MSARAAALAAVVVLPVVALPLGHAGEPSRPAAPLVAPAGVDAAARAAVAALPRATRVNDADGDGVFDDLAAALRDAGGARVPVVVSFVASVAPGDGVAAARAVAPGVVVDRSFRIVPAFAGRLTATEVARVATLPQVRQVELDRAGTAELETATAVMGADEAVDGLGVTGSLDGRPDVATAGDVTIGVLDTGFHVQHQELRGKMLAWRDFGTGRSAPYDPDGHGTHVASIAAGWGADPRHRGVAPGAALVGVKIDGGGTTVSNAIAGYEWLVANKDRYGIRVATISFGFGTATDGTTALERTVDATWDAGIVCFKSNGNSGPGRSTMTVPAAARGVLAVGNVLDPRGAPGTTNYGFALAQSSSRGPTSDGRVKPDLVAPGTSITAAATASTNGYATLTGTSMAAPFAAGAAALVIAADPSLTPDEVRTVMLATTEDRGAPGADQEFGHGRLRVWHAVAEVLRRRGVDTGASTAPAVPVQQSFVATPVDGRFETTLDVRDTGFPVAVTAISDGAAVGAVALFDAAGNLVSPATAVPNGGPDRHHGNGFQPAAPGRYTLRVLTQPGSRLVVDVSHSTTR